MYVAKIDTETNPYLDTTAKFLQEKFPFETKSSGISRKYSWGRGMKSLFGRNINIFRGSKASVISKSTPSTGLLSLLNTMPSA